MAYYTALHPSSNNNTLYWRSRQADIISQGPLGHHPQKPPSRPSSRQALLQQELQDQQNFTRSRSLGGYYQQNQPAAPPIRNQQLLRNQQQPANQVPHPGSMTPLSYAKWQHSQPPKRYNPLYDTPPTQRHPMMRPQGLQMAEIRGVMGNASPLHAVSGQQAGHLRVGQPPRQLLTEPVLSPILTDTEISPLHRTGLGSAPGKISFNLNHDTAL